MYRRIYRYWFVLPLLLLVILLRDWVEEPTAEELEKTLDMHSTQTDYYLEKFETRKFDVQGQPEYVLVGETLKHFPADGSSEIDQPRLTFHEPESIWDITSEQGRLTIDPDIFTLLGDVQINRLTITEPSNLTIHTSDLVIHAGTRYIETDKAIEVISPAWSLKSIGLQSHINDGILVLTSNVEGHYAIEPR